MSSKTRSPAQVFALLFGAVLTVAGILGFFVNASFEIADRVDRDTLILFDINGWHNVVHLVSGVIGLGLAGSWAGARAYAFGLGAVYVVLTIVGFIVGDGGTLVMLVPINIEDNFLHLAIAIAGLAAGAATPAAPAPTTAAAA